MAARAIWKGTLHIGDLEVPVKMYSAVEDRTVHLRLLDEGSRKPVQQKIVRKSDGKEVPEAQRRKAYVLDREHAVILTPEELESVEPASSRDIALEHFVPSNVIGDQWYDRPYYLGPDED